MSKRDLLMSKRDLLMPPLSNADKFNAATYNSPDTLSLPLAHAHSENGTSSVTCPASLWQSANSSTNYSSGMGALRNSCLGALWNSYLTTRNSCLGMVGRGRLKKDVKKDAGVEGRRGGVASQAAPVTGGGGGAVPHASPSRLASSGARHQSPYAVGVFLTLVGLF